ncbi:hypothetical protein J6590_103498 [Homalodisca vitripennis]|nr:hypothetical protein J6590_088201 [Homalodisca vitripennis]KAG8313945.1 hypothetical protein J6590_103498 [Homalodisca vitripennis]
MNALLRCPAARQTPSHLHPPVDTSEIVSAYRPENCCSETYFVWTCTGKGLIPVYPEIRLGKDFSVYR